MLTTLAEGPSPTTAAVWGLVLVLAALGTLVQAIRLGGGGRITPAYVALLYRAGIAATARAL